MATELSKEEDKLIYKHREEKKHRAVRNALLAIKAEYPEGMSRGQIESVVGLLSNDLLSLLKNDWSNMEERCHSFRKEW